MISVEGDFVRTWRYGRRRIRHKARKYRRFGGFKHNHLWLTAFEFCLSAHERNEYVGNADRTVGKLALFDERGEYSRRCKPRTVERVDESRFARFLISESPIKTSTRQGCKWGS